MTDSTFGERFRFARWHEQRVRPAESDTAFGLALGMSKASVSGWGTADTPPPEDVVLAIAERTGVDPGWLTYGASTSAEEPPDFASWLKAQRRKERAAKPDPADVPRGRGKRTKLSGPADVRKPKRA